MPYRIGFYFFSYLIMLFFNLINGCIVSAEEVVVSNISPQQTNADIYNSKFGFIDRNGQYKIRPQFDFARPFAEGYAVVTSFEPHGFQGFIDKTGSVVIEPKYSFCNKFSEGLAVVRHNNGCAGYIDKQGNIVIPMIYSLASDFTNGLAIVYVSSEVTPYTNTEFRLADLTPDFGKSGSNVNLNPVVLHNISKAGFIDHNGKFVIEAKYEQAGPFIEGLACVKQNGLSGYIDVKGHVVIPFQYSSAGEFGEGLASVEINGKDGFIDKRGQVVIKPAYDYSDVFYYGRARVRIEPQHWVFINHGGNVVAGKRYDFIGNYREGLARFASKGKMGFVDLEGTVVVKPEYDEVEDFSEGMARVKVGDKYGFINKKGDLVIKPIYDNAENFSDGLAPVLCERH